MTSLPAFGAFILDLDGTAVDTAPDIARSANRTLAELGLPELPYDLVASYIGGGVTVLMQRCLGDLAEQYMDRAVPLFLRLYAAEPAATSKVYPGVAETMRIIADRGGKMGICTQKPEALSQAILEQLGIVDYVSSLVGPESVTHRKPHPEPVLKVLEELGCDASDAIFVGDAASDMVAAVAADVATCAVSYGYGSVDSLQAENPDFMIDSFAELLDHVQVR